MSSFEIKGTNGVTARLSWEETVLEDQNKSVLAVTLSITSAWNGGINYWLAGTAVGKTLNSNYDRVYVPNLNLYGKVAGTPWELTVDHEQDGTGAVTLAVDVWGYTPDGNYGSGWHVRGSRTVELTPIARSSAVAATDGDIGGVSMIAVTRKNSNYSHYLQYSFGSLSGYITEAGEIAQEKVLMTAAAIPFAIPESFYGQIPDSPTGRCRITCTTEKAGVQVAEPTVAEFTVTAPEGVCRPVLQAQVEDVNEKTLALTGDPSVLIRFASTARCTAQAQGQKQATVLSLTAQGQPLPLEVENVQDGSFLFSAVDSRGYETACLLGVPMVQYVQLTANATCVRTDPVDGKAMLTVRGSCYTGSFGSRDNSLTLRAQVGDQVFSLSPQMQSNSYYAQLELTGLDYAQNYTVTVTVDDALSQVTALLELGRGVPVFDWGRKDFAFHVPVTAPSINGVRNVALKSWPVGAVYMAADDRSPAQTIGGKWEKLENIGIDLNLWRRLQGADLLGTAKLGSLTLGEEF